MRGCRDWHRRGRWRTGSSGGAGRGGRRYAREGVEALVREYERIELTQVAFACRAGVLYETFGEWGAEIRCHHAIVDIRTGASLRRGHGA